MEVAVIGGGISGLVAAYILANSGVHVVVYDKEDCLGGHAKTVNFDGVDLDLNFMLFNTVTCSNMEELFEGLGVDLDTSDMSFSVSLHNGRGVEWGTRNGLSSIFAQKLNVLSPQFWKMLREMLKFKDDVLRFLEVHERNIDKDTNETLGEFVKSRGYSELFQKAYLVPLCGSLWCCPYAEVLGFSAFSVLSFFRNNHLLQLFGSSQWLSTAKQHSQNFVQKVRAVLENNDRAIRVSSEVHSVSTTEEGCVVLRGDGSKEMYTGCIIAVHGRDALRMLGEQATYDERRVLGAFHYVHSDIILHRDKNFMPRNPAAWSARNFLESTDEKSCLTLWLNQLQNIGETSLPFLVTLNPYQTPKHTLLKWSTEHPVPSVAASKALKQLESIQGRRRLWFSGCYEGYGYQEDALKAGIAAANSVLGKSCALLSNPKHMVPSLLETGARLFVTKFLRDFMNTGCLVLIEEGGTTFTFDRMRKGSSLKCVLRIHSPRFYWKVMTQADLGFADAYIQGDISFPDKDEGLLNFFLVLVANSDFYSSAKRQKYRGWWTPYFSTAVISSAKYFYDHMSRKNTLTQARRNISRHYDLSTELFSLFLDEAMSYSCAIFKHEEEDLKTAQLRKNSRLIEKARIDKKHEVLEIGFGWGGFAVEVVRQTGCKYTGITLSKEQLKFAEERAKDAGLQDRIKFLLCDYRQLPNSIKYDRIISCGMIEHVGHEYMELFFASCESLLAEDGRLVLQFILIPDQRYDAHRRSPDFIKEYIFPGACAPSLSRVTSAMATASRLCVEHLESIGSHYYYTLRKWRKNFLSKQSEILGLGFDEKFIRTWEYYFDYIAAGMKSGSLTDYQMVFSRPDYNKATFSDPFKSWPSA